MFTFKRNYLSIILSISTINISIAQSVSVTLWRDSVETVVGATFTNRLTIANPGTQAREIRLAVQIPPAAQLLSVVPDRLFIAPGSVAVVPIKGLMNRKTNTLLNPVSIRVDDPAGKKLQSVSFQLVAKGNFQSPVSLYMPEDNIVLFAGSESAHLPLRLVHNRPKAETFFIDINSLPDGVDRSHFPLAIRLGPNQDTTVSILASSLSRHWSLSEPYQLILNVRDQQKSVVGTVVYKLVVAVADKRYEKANADTRLGYGASAALTRFSSDQWAKETRVWGSDSIGKGQIDFQIQYLNYGASQFQQIQNSFISYRTEQSTVRLGNIYDFHELPLFGRGVKATLAQKNAQWTLWAINANPNWLSMDENAWSGNVFSVRYDQQLATLPGGSLSLSSNYFTQPSVSRAGYLNFASFRYDRSERHSLQVLVGQSMEFSRRNTSQAHLFGWTSQVNYTYQSPKVGWQLRSYLSNPAYSGLQKGAALLYSQLFWQPSAFTTVLARLNYVHYNRISFTSAVDYNRQNFGNAVAEVSLSHRIRQIALGLRPYWFSQSDQDNPVSPRANAYRVAPSLSYNRRSYQHIDISYDAGLFYANTPAESFRGLLSQRFVSTLRMGAFSFWGYWQKGPYYLFDLRNTQPNRIRTMSLTPSFSFALLNRRLAGSVGLNYAYDAMLAQSRYTAVGRVQYEATPTLSVNLFGNGTPYSQRPEFAYSQYRMEVVKRFNHLPLARGGQLQLSFFEDGNGNGNKDTGERWVDSLLVTVDDNTLLTNAKGIITYKNIPPGTYTVSAISAGRLGDPVLYHEKITIARSVSKVIPLVLTFRVKGQLRCQVNTYDQQPCQFNRFMVEIQRGQETISSTGLLPDGTFSVHLSPGTYTLLVHDYGRQQQTVIKKTTFVVTAAGHYPSFDWPVDASTRPVDVKRFKARSTR